MRNFQDRLDAGQQLAERLLPLRGQDVVVLGLPRGGVPVADVVARALNAPLDVVMVRKLGVPTQPEFAMGAIAEDGARVVDERTVGLLRITPEEVAAVERHEQEVLSERAVRFREGREAVSLAGRTVVIVDDGVATGATARVACLTARRKGAARVIVAVPVAPPQVHSQIPEADEVVALVTPEPFRAVGLHYRDFSQTSDEQVVAILDDAARRSSEVAADPQRTRQDAVRAAPPNRPGTAVVSQDVAIPADQVQLAGHLTVPFADAPVVVFAHGSGSSRHSPRNRYVASVLQRSGLGTLLLDLLTPAEETDRGNVFDIGLLAGRLTAALAWVRRQPHSTSSPIGLFGASTGAGAALRAAAEPGSRVSAVVSRGGRPDLAGPLLDRVEAPTLLIVGGSDPQVLELNRKAQAQLTCRNRLEVVAGATHLFEEPGTLEEAARLARDWFVEYLSSADGDPPHP